MGVRELLLIFLGIGLIGFFTYQRLLRALFFVFVLWSATLMSALVYEPVAFRGKALLTNRPLAEGGLFIVFLVIFSVVGYVLVYNAFPDTTLPKIGIFDHLLGFLVGVLIAVLVISLIMNGVGVMIREQWTKNLQGWVNLNASYNNSILRPITRQVIGLYSITYFLFFRTMPSALTPQ